MMVAIINSAIVNSAILDSTSAMLESDTYFSLLIHSKTLSLHSDFDSN